MGKKYNALKIPITIREQPVSKENEGYFVTIEKLSDDKFEGFHPNGILEGYRNSGYAKDKPTVGKPFIISTVRGGFKTSIVTEIIDKYTFKTLNSTYRITITEDKVT